MKAEKLILVDGSSYLYRAFHALPPLSTSKGQPTGAMYGVVNMLRKIIADYAPQYVAVVFDAKGKTFRDDLYAHYKAHRPAMPDELRSQIKPLTQLVQALGLPMLSVEGVEADDVIGTLAVEAAQMGLQTIISTVDKDLAQLVNAKVSLINTMNNSLLDEQGVVDKFGVCADQIIDYLTLVGDTSDNIPGVPKVGAKTAVKWLEKYKSLDSIIEHADEIGGKVGENLRAHLDQIPLSRQLATIKCDVPLELKANQLKPAAADEEMLKTLYQEYEFKNWLAEISPSQDSSSLNNNYEIVLEEKELTRWLQKLKNAPLFAFDLESTSLDYMQAKIVGVSFAVEAGEAAYVPLAHDYTDAPTQLDLTEVLARLKPLLQDKKLKKVGQNLKYDMSVLANYDIRLNGIEIDKMLESYVLDSTASRHDMDSLALKYLGHNTIHFVDIAGKGKSQLTFNQISLDQAGPYAAEDADITLKLHNVLWPRLCDQEKVKALFMQIEIPLVSVLSRIERNGVFVDALELQRQSADLQSSIADLERQAYELAGHEFNLGSPKQLQEILFVQQKIPVLQKTPGGQASTSESVLQELALDYPLPAVILKYRSLSKLKSTYTDQLPKQVNLDTGRVHTSYHQAVASTGRLSSSDPNLQNIPIKTQEGRRIRQAFIAPQNYLILAADYSQIELRILAHLSQDPGLLKAFENNEDIHTATASEVFNTPFAQVSKDERRKAKAINFGLVYGMSAFGLAKQLGTERKTAQSYIDQYFEKYPGVKNYMELLRNQARESGYVETVFGRRLYLPEINSRNFQRRQYAERTAINAPMQGTAADLIKRAMIKVDSWLEQSKVDAKMIMQVHDELVFEVAQVDKETISRHVVDIMSQAPEISVPLVVDFGFGHNWDEAH